jgi:prophage regulatory protein
MPPSKSQAPAVKSPEVVLQRLPRVRERTGLSSSEIYRRIAAGTFPAPVKIGPRCSAWHAAEIDAWITACIHARDAKGGA